MSGKNIQIFSTGERREYQVDGLEQTLKKLTRAKGDKSDSDLVGKTAGAVEKLPLHKEADNV